MRINENTKITMTVGQIRRLIREANGSTLASTAMNLKTAVQIIGGAQQNGQGIQLNSQAKSALQNEIVKQAGGKIDAGTAVKLTNTTLQFVENPRFLPIAAKIGKALLRNNGFIPIAILARTAKPLYDELKTIKKMRSDGKSWNEIGKSRGTIKNRIAFLKKSFSLDPFEKAFLKKCVFSIGFWIALITFIAACIGTGGATVGTAGAAAPTMAAILRAAEPLAGFFVSAAIEADAIEQKQNQDQNPDTELAQVAESLYRRRRMRRFN